MKETNKWINKNLDVKENFLIQF